MPFKIIAGSVNLMTSLALQIVKCSAQHEGIYIGKQNDCLNYFKEVFLVPSERSYQRNTRTSTLYVLSKAFITPLRMSPGWGHMLCSWARHFTLTVPLSTQVYKWVTPNLMLGVTLRWTAYYPGGSRNTLVASWYRNRDKLRPDDGPLNSYVYADFAFLSCFS